MPGQERSGGFAVHDAGLRPKSAKTSVKTSASGVATCREHGAVRRPEAAA